MNNSYINQDLLLSQLKHIFPKEDPLVEARKQFKLKYPTTGSYLEIDIWFPNINIGFEFQDTYHYITTWYSQRTKENIQVSDSAKRIMSQQSGICLIEVPCWWDGEVASLASTISFQRPDLMPSVLAPISLNPPLGFFPEGGLPDVGELMLASFPLTSSTDFVNSSSWWMGEKYDGVRFCWNPNQSTLYSRHGKKLALLPNMEDNFPREFIDGEIWFGRGAFSLTHVLCKGSTDAVHWHVLRAVSFDIPAPRIHSLPFEGRYELLCNTIDEGHPVIIVVPRVACQGSDHMSRAVADIIENSGEGSILRLVGSCYTHGRTDSLIKFKAANADKDGLVIGVEEGHVTLKLPNGQMFKVPPHDVHIPTPSEGDVVTFSYEINSRRDTPVSPIIYRTRTDVEWDDLLHSDVSEQAYLINNEPAQKKIFTSHPQGFWTHANMRAYMEDLARSFNMDPLSSETWLNIPFKSVSQSKSGRIIVQKFGGFSTAIKSLFPEVDLESASHNVWSSIEHRRKFFENYARNHRFDPHNPEHWYSQRPQHILSQKGASRVMFYHGYSVPKALMDLFPDIGLDKSKLGKWSWQYAVNRRQFFELFAANNNFDPLVAENWYSQPRDELMSTAAPFVILHHNNLMAQALIDLFPDVPLDRLRLLYHFDSRHMANGRRFFENYAKVNGFDPLIPENWYNQPLKKIIAIEGAKKILAQHNHTLSDALLDLFPNIGLEKAYFTRSIATSLSKMATLENESLVEAHSKKILPEAEKSVSTEKFKLVDKSELPPVGKPIEKVVPTEKVRDAHSYSKQFFVSYAKQNGFDPLIPENWYSQSRTRLMSTKGATKAIAKFKGSISKALLAVFPKIGLIKSKLWATLWNELKSRRRFFETYATNNGFDPLIPSNWYSISIDHIVSEKGFVDVIIHHKDSLTQALCDLFPEIGLEQEKMSPHCIWHNASTRRKYFENYAKVHGFDPLDPHAWLSQSQEKILSFKGAARVISYHQGKVSKALLDLFPDIGLLRSSFWSRLSLEDPINRRKLFERYAKDYGFDPLLASNWYAHKDNLVNAKGVNSVLRYHNKSLAKALVDLFPSIGLELPLLRTGPTWPDRDTRRKVFENYARANGCDPHNPDTWYSLPKSRIASLKGGYMTMAFYKGNVQNALLDLFPDIGLDISKLSTILSSEGHKIIKIQN